MKTTPTHLRTSPLILERGRGIKSSNNLQIMLKTSKNPRKLKIKLLMTITSIKNQYKITKTPYNFHLHQKNQMAMIQMNQIHNKRKTQNLKPMAYIQKLMSFSFQKESIYHTTTCKGDCRVRLSRILAEGPKLIYYAK